MEARLKEYYGHLAYERILKFIQEEDARFNAEETNRLSVLRKNPTLEVIDLTSDDDEISSIEDDLWSKILKETIMKIEKDLFDRNLYDDLVLDVEDAQIERNNGLSYSKTRKISSTNPQEKEFYNFEESNPPLPAAIREKIIEEWIAIIQHARICDTGDCGETECIITKKRLEHTQVCKSKTDPELAFRCSICRYFRDLACYHARQCKQDDCSVFCCSSIKSKFAKELKEENNRHLNILSRSIFANTKISYDAPETSIYFKTRMLPRAQDYRRNMVILQSLAEPFELRGLSTPEKHTFGPHITFSDMKDVSSGNPSTFPNRLFTPQHIAQEKANNPQVEFGRGKAACESASSSIAENRNSLCDMTRQSTPGDYPPAKRMRPLDPFPSNWHGEFPQLTPQYPPQINNSFNPYLPGTSRQNPLSFPAPTPFKPPIPQPSLPTPRFFSIHHPIAGYSAFEYIPPKQPELASNGPEARFAPQMSQQPTVNQEKVGPKVNCFILPSNVAVKFVYIPQDANVRMVMTPPQWPALMPLPPASNQKVAMFLVEQKTTDANKFSPQCNHIVPELVEKSTQTTQESRQVNLKSAQTQTDNVPEETLPVKKTLNFKLPAERKRYRMKTLLNRLKKHQLERKELLSIIRKQPNLMEIIKKFKNQQ